VATRRRVTREMIIAEARRLVAEHGTAALTFQALASILGVSKQAILYWFPSKRALARHFCLPLLKEERDVVTAAIPDGESQKTTESPRLSRRARRPASTSSSVSRLKIEKVVKPPQKPVSTNCRVAGDASSRPPGSVSVA
jgi:AcrR family transcriptional regulator